MVGDGAFATLSAGRGCDTVGAGSAVRAGSSVRAGATPGMLATPLGGVGVVSRSDVAGVERPGTGADVVWFCAGAAVV